MSSASVVSLPPSSPSSGHTMRRESPIPNYQHLHLRPSGLIAPSPTLKPNPLPSALSASSIARVTESSSPALASGSALQHQTSAATKKDGGSLVQPKKEWVLPARAKPGRKPSVTEPLTKRKAQNRASQRAFRERKQSYLQELESKVAAYETSEIDRSVELQKLAQKLNLENEGLRKEVASWKQKATQLEDVLKKVQQTGKLTGVVPSPKSGPGCKAPSHEKPAPLMRSVLSTPGAKPKEKGEVRFAEPLYSSGPAVALSIPRKQGEGIDRSATLSQPSRQSVLQTLPPSPNGAGKSLWATATNVRNHPSEPRTFPQTQSQVLGSLSPPLMLPQRLPIDGGCGFCTEASPCVCAEDYFDLSGATTSMSPSTPPKTSEGSSAISVTYKQPAGAVEGGNRMSIPSLTTKLASSPQLPRPKKLWYTVQAEQGQAWLSSASRPLSTLRSQNNKLWYTTEASASRTVVPEPVCTGDPGTCGACSTDPGLAAFCEAVTTAATTPQWRTDSSAQRPVLARARSCSQSGTKPLDSSRLVTAPSRSQGETIPSAWRQIRSHPRFSQWQGGLDLLAEVVSKRSGSVHSPLLQEPTLAQKTREAPVDIEPVRSTQLLPMTSNDRATSSVSVKPTLLHSTSDTSVYAATKVKRGCEDEERSEADREQKKRRILIDRAAVQEALAMLDAGTLAQPRFGQNRSQAEDDTLPCPCPWRPGERHTN